MNDLFIYMKHKLIIALVAAVLLAGCYRPMPKKSSVAEVLGVSMDDIEFITSAGDISARGEGVDYWEYKISPEGLERFNPSDSVFPKKESFENATSWRPLATDTISRDLVTIRYGGSTRISRKMNHLCDKINQTPQHLLAAIYRRHCHDDDMMGYYCSDIYAYILDTASGDLYVIYLNS